MGHRRRRTTCRRGDGCRLRCGLFVWGERGWWLLILLGGDSNGLCKAEIHGLCARSGTTMPSLGNTRLDRSIVVVGC